MTRHLFVPALSVALYAASVSGAAIPEKSSLSVPRVPRPPSLEQFFGETARGPGAKIAEFWQRQPNDGKPASLETTAYVSYDDSAFYVVFVCHDEPSQVRARMSRRESISGDDIVGVAVDTFHDGRRAY